MKKSNVVFILCFFICSLVVTPVHAFSLFGKEEEKKAKIPSEIFQYIEELISQPEGSYSEIRLRKKIISMVLDLGEEPELPEDARRFLVRGRMAIKSADYQESYLRAGSEFKRALIIAPWAGEAYYNLGVTLEKTGLYDEAMRNLEFYLLASPDAEDVEMVRDKIYEIEYQKEEAERQEYRMRQKELQERQEEKQLASQDITGVWKEEGHPDNEFTTYYKVEKHDEEFYMETFNDQPDVDVVPYKYRLTINDFKVEGIATEDYTFLDNGRAFEHPVSGTLARDGSTLQLEYTSTQPGSSYGEATNDWVEWERHITFVRSEEKTDI